MHGPKFNGCLFAWIWVKPDGLNEELFYFTWGERLVQSTQCGGIKHITWPIGPEEVSSWLGHGSAILTVIAGWFVTRNSKCQTWIIGWSLATLLWTKFQVYKKCFLWECGEVIVPRNSKYQTCIIGWSTPTFLCPQISNAKYISYRCMVRNLSNAFLDRFEWNQTV